MTDPVTGGAPDVRQRPLLIAGMPRSGTSWTQEVLECDDQLYSLREPDSEADCPSAIWAKRQSGRFPVLAPGDRDDNYRQLWAWSLDGATETLRLRLAGKMLEYMSPPTGGDITRLRARSVLERKRYLRGAWSPFMSLAGALAQHPPAHRNPELDGHRLLIKTVHVPLSLEWLASEFDLDVLVLLRHPGSVLASWITLDMNAQYIPFSDRPAVRQLAREWGVQLPGPDHLEQMIWQIGALTLALELAAANHPEWSLRTHEQLCLDPIEEFRELYADLGLRWSERTESFLVEHDKPGKGFRTQRVAGQLPDAWKQRLTADQIGELARVLSWFPLKTWSPDDFTAGTEG
jgi:hypothetical protein